MSPRIDAACAYVREASRIVSVAVVMAVGIDTDGRRAVLGGGPRAHLPVPP